MNTDCVTVSTIVKADPAHAFDAFTNGIAGWWKPKVRGLFQAGKSGTLRFEGGKLVEYYDEGEPFEIGRVIVWEPPRRLAFDWRQEGCAADERTQVEVRFEPVPGGTRVTVEHRGWDALPAGHPARHGYTGGAFVSLIGLRWADALTAFAHA